MKRNLYAKNNVLVEKNVNVCRKMAKKAWRQKNKHSRVLVKSFFDDM